MNLTKVVVSLLILVSAIGCTPQIKNRLPEGTENRNISTQQAVSMYSTEVKVVYPVSGAGGAAFGLAGALIEVGIASSRSKNATKKIKKINDEVKIMEYLESFESAFKDQMEKVQWLNLVKSQTTDIVDKKFKSSVTKDTPGFLEVKCGIYMLPGLDKMRLHAEVRLEDYSYEESGRVNSKSRKRPSKTIYFNHVYYDIYLENEISDKENIADAWLVNGGQKLKNNIQKGILGLAEAVYFDINNRDKSPSAYRNAGQIKSDIGQYKKVVVVKEVGDRVYARSPEGLLISLPSKAIQK